MAKHTPGPWVYRPDHLHSIAGPENELIAKIPRWMLAQESECKANARLIAAAPDLREALADVMAWFNGMRHIMHEQGEGAEHDKLAKAARVALKRCE